MLKKLSTIVLVLAVAGSGYCFAKQSAAAAAAASRLRSPDRLEVIAAVRTLAQDASPESTTALADLFRRSNDTYIKVQAIEALTLQQSTGALAAVLGALDDPNPQVRQSAMVNLGYFGDDRKVVAAIEKALKNETNTEVSISAVNSLSVYKSSRAVEAVDAVLSNKAADKRLRLHAARSLKRMGTKESGNRLSRYNRDADPEVRKAVQKEQGQSSNQGNSRSRRNRKQ